jgi:phytoene synthase
MQDAFAHCEALVRTADKGRYLASLFAPAERRAGLFALYAFNVEVIRVRRAVRDPIAGEIRLQWWSEALAGMGRGDVEANPVAAALLTAIAQFRLPVADFQRILDAHRMSLYDAPKSTVSDLDAYLDGTSTTVFSLAARILHAGEPPGPLILAAGRACGIAGLLTAAPDAAGALPVTEPGLAPAGEGLGDLRLAARAYLAEGRRLIGAAPAAIIPALLPVALVGPTLMLIERKHDDRAKPAVLSPWRRQWLIWRAARKPARIFG